MKEDFHSLSPPSAATSRTNKELPVAHVVKFASDGTPDVLEFKDVPEPQPAAGEVNIRVKAIGLNRAEAAPSNVRQRVSGASTERWQITVHRVKIPQA